MVFSTATSHSGSIPHVTTPEMIQPNIPNTRGHPSETLTACSESEIPVTAKTSTAATSNLLTTVSSNSLTAKSTNPTSLIFAPDSSDSSATESYCMRFKEVQ